MEKPRPPRWWVRPLLAVWDFLPIAAAVGVGLSVWWIVNACLEARR